MVRRCLEDLLVVPFDADFAVVLHKLLLPAWMIPLPASLALCIVLPGQLRPCTYLALLTVIG